MQTVISVQGIVKNYGAFRAVDQLNFDVHTGEIFALLGPNGAGKSTTIRMMLDIIKPDEGVIAVFDAQLSDEAKNRIGYLPEERGLYQKVEVITMMTYFGTLKGMSSADARRSAMVLLERLDLAGYATRKTSELSKGMQQKVQFAITVMHNPDLIVIDEPFAGLDPVNRLVIKDLLMELRDRGGAIVMSTHQMNQVEEMADRLLMIDHGKQKLYGELDEIRRDFALRAIVVQGEGNWVEIPGVERVEQSRNGRNGVLLHLEPDATADGVLAAIALDDTKHIERFELAVPSMDEIFIRVAGEE